MDILYQDDEIVAINKPAGLLVHRSRIDVHANEFALQTLRDQIGKPVFLVHRLDRPTSGVLLFAFNRESARHLANQFANRSVSKSYRAIVRGHTSDSGRWDEPLIEKLDQISDDQADANKAPQSAVTEFATITRWEVPFSSGKYANSRYSEVTIKPLTGRKHQIRRHFNHMAHPIVGDTTHGDRRHNRSFRENFQVSRLLLVAQQIEFIHPVSKANMNIVASLGSEFEFALQQLNKYALA